VLRRLFSEDIVDFTGRFDRIDRAALSPGRRAPFRSGSAGRAPKRSIAPPGWLTDSSSSASAESTAPSSRGRR